MNVELHIEELVLHGVTPVNRQRLAAVMERELARLLAEQGVPPTLVRDGDVAQLHGGSSNIALGSRPDAIGLQVAQAIYGVMKHA